MRIDPQEFWTEMTQPGPDAVQVRGVELRRGSRVRLHPRPGGDIFDVALAGRTAVVEGLDEDDEGRIHVSVTLDDDPGRDLGEQRRVGHRFFFRLDEVEPLDRRPRVLVAGVGNLFLGDDGFGVEVANRLAARGVPDGVTVRDFGIRGMDLALALRDYDVALFVDTTRRGAEPGSLHLIDASVDTEAAPTIATHGMDPVRVLALARELGPLPHRLLVLGCEPASIPDPEADEMVGALSPPVAEAVDEALRRIDALLDELMTKEE